jgi:hypothetical protein
LASIHPYPRSANQIKFRFRRPEIKFRPSAILKYLIITNKSRQRLKIPAIRCEISKLQMGQVTEIAKSSDSVAEKAQKMTDLAVDKTVEKVKRESGSAASAVKSFIAGNLPAFPCTQ